MWSLAPYSDDGSYEPFANDQGGTSKKSAS